MKSYNDFLEAVSARRLAQLRAKGKGDAADAKMKADGLSRPRVQGQKEKARRIAQGKGGQNRGGALAIRPKGQPGMRQVTGGLARDVAGAAARAAANKGAAIVRQRMQPKAVQKAAPSKITPAKKAKPGKLTRTPQAKASGSPENKRPTRVGAVEKDDRKKRALQKIKDDAKKKKDNQYKGGFMGGVKKGLGGDLFHSDNDIRKKARFERGQKTVDGVKNFVKGLKVARTNTGIEGADSVSGPKKFGRSAS